MTFLKNFPLLIVPFILYNFLSFGLITKPIQSFQTEFLSIEMMSGSTFSIDIGNLLVTLALILLFIEILKATRTGKTTIIDHLLSTFVFIAYLIQFIIDPKAATSSYFICLVIAFLDVAAGYSISIRVAARDVTLER